MQRDPCISRSHLSANHLPACPGCLSSVDSSQGQNHPEACSDRISIAFSSLKVPGRVDSCWKYAVRYSGQLRSHTVTPPVCPDTGDLCFCMCSSSRTAGVGWLGAAPSPPAALSLQMSSQAFVPHMHSLLEAYSLRNLALNQVSFQWLERHFSSPVV